MRSILPFLFAGTLFAFGCKPPEPVETAQEAVEAEEETVETPEEVDPSELADTWIEGIYSSQRYNVRFSLPENWRPIGENENAGPLGLGNSDDSLTLLGPPGTNIRMVVANSGSIQLADTSFNNLDSRVGFDNVNIVPDRSRGGSFNGVPGYRTEGDALLRGEGMPIAFMAQALDLPGTPTMLTIFLPLDMYSMCYGDLPDSPDDAVLPETVPEGTGEEAELAPAARECDGNYYSDAIASILNSVEVIDLRRE